LLRFEHDEALDARLVGASTPREILAPEPLTPARRE
jgi:hypothetical protein